MWSVCNPKSDGELKECAVLGKSLSRLSQPTILTVLAEANEPLHGYLIVQRAAASPMFGGNKPDATGVYRTLKAMEEQGLVTSEWATPKAGPAKRTFTLTEAGRATLRRWIDSLACYALSIEELRELAAGALGIDVPPTPVCH
jgi:DNA-binding PadR family transcriptional regulator